MKMIQAGIGLLGLALLAGCETRVEERGEGGDLREWDVPAWVRWHVWERHLRARTLRDKTGLVDSQGYWHEDRHYRH